MDIDILLALQDGIPIVKEPFTAIAERLGIESGEVIERLKKLQGEKVIRRFGVFVRNRKVGIIANAMVVWAVPSHRIQEVGNFISKFKEVTHCYQRQTILGKWKYNLYAVIHGFKRETVREFVRKLSEEVEIKDYLILFSTKEFIRRSSGRVRAKDRTLVGD